MTKPVLRRVQVTKDIQQVVDNLSAEAGAAVALAFIDALEEAFDQIKEFPASGSPRYAYELNLPGLRYWSVKQYHRLIFYVEQADHIDVWRVLHSAQDIPTWLRATDG